MYGAATFPAPLALTRVPRAGRVVLRRAHEAAAVAELDQRHLRCHAMHRFLTNRVSSCERPDRERGTRGLPRGGRGGGRGLFTLSSADPGPEAGGDAFTLYTFECL